MTKKAANRVRKTAHVARRRKLTGVTALRAILAGDGRAIDAWLDAEAGSLAALHPVVVAALIAEADDADE